MELTTPFALSVPALVGCAGIQSILLGLRYGVQSMEVRIRLTGATTPGRVSICAGKLTSSLLPCLRAAGPVRIYQDFPRGEGQWSVQSTSFVVTPGALALLPLVSVIIFCFLFY